MGFEQATGEEGECEIEGGGEDEERGWVEVGVGRGAGSGEGGRDGGEGGWRGQGKGKGKGERVSGLWIFWEWFMMVG